VLRRQQPDGKVYYLLHIKPSKYERARVIPIGDGLGRVIAEIIRHVKRFYRTDHVPSCDHWDEAEKRARPRAPYLLQGAGHPSALAVQGIRSRLARLSRLAETKRADGQPLILRPHDCRRLFASELLNNSVAPHVIQALLGHAHIDTMMIYAKLYPSTLVEDYRKAVRSSYFHGPDSLRAPTHAEWEEFSRSCNLRDMGTHLCALPTGEHCSRGLCASAAATPSPRRPPRQCSAGCSPATSVPSIALATVGSRRGSSRPASSRFTASRARCEEPTSSPPTSRPRSKLPPDQASEPHRSHRKDLHGVLALGRVRRLGL
jgi:Phage integrase family